jgi:CHAD domain-containing protein
MQPKRIQDILQKDIRKLAVAAREIAPQFRTEDVHRFRVGIKKLRAFVHFINAIKGQPEVLLGDRLKRLYAISGTLRDAHLKYETLTGRQLHLPQYYGNLSAMVQRNKTEWHKAYNEKIFNKLSKEMEGLSFKDVAPADLALFLAQKVKKIKKINSSNPDDEHIHRMRKLIKDIVYITAFVAKKWEGAHDIIKIIPQGQLTDIANLVGNFNDGSILLHELSSFSSMGMRQEERAAMAGYVTEAMARHTLLKKELLRQIAAFVEEVEGKMQ